MRGKRERIGKTKHEEGRGVRNGKRLSGRRVHGLWR
jgi:hypothetical protein